VSVETTRLAESIAGGGGNTGAVVVRRAVVDFSSSTSRLGSFCSAWIANIMLSRPLVALVVVALE